MTVREKTFWMVFGGLCSAPTVRHESATSARNEARRLALLNPGVEFVVLKSTIGYTVALEPITETWYDVQ